MPDHAPSQELRTHVLEIRERMRTCRQRLLLHPEDESVRLAVDLEIEDIQTHCLHVHGKGYTIQGIPGFSCGECGLRTGAREGRWDPIPMSAWEKKVGRFRKACWSFHEQCQTFRLAKRAYRLYHHYDYATTPAAYVIGRGHPASIVAYLQFRAEREMPFEAQLENEGAALLLTKFYGYKETPPTDACEDVDLYEIREFRCERKWHNRIARLLYWRPGISRELAPCVEEC